MYERVIDMEPAAPPPPRPRVTTALAALGLACLLSAGIAWTWYRAARLPSLPAPEDPDAVAQGGAKVRQLVLPPPGRLLADWSPEDGGLTHQLRVAFVRFDLGSPTPRLVSELVQPIAAPHPAQFEGAVDSAFAVPPVEPLPVIHRYHLPGPLHRWHSPDIALDW